MWAIGFRGLHDIVDASGTGRRALASLRFRKVSVPESDGSWKVPLILPRTSGSTGTPSAAGLAVLIVLEVLVTAGVSAYERSYEVAAARTRERLS
jgi:hypothetical protein